MKRNRIITTILVVCMSLLLAFGLTACNGFSQADIDNAVNQATAPLTEQITELEADIAEKEAKIATLEGEKAALSTEKSELEADIQEIETEVTALETEKATLEAEVAALEEEKASLTTDKATLEACIAAKNSEIATLNSSIATLTAEKKTLNNKVSELERENKELEERVEILLNCAKGNHDFARYEYKFSTDFTTADKNTICLNCGKVHETETVATVYEAPKLTAIFADNDVKVWDLTDGTVLTAEELRLAVSYMLSIDERELDITLPAEADIDKLLAIREALVKTGVREGSISLTLRGITEIPDYSFSDTDNRGTGIFGLWFTEDGMENVIALRSVTLTDAVYIGEDAFYYCRWLSYFSAPLATEVGKYAFESTTALSEVYLPLVETVGADAFSSCVFSEISFPKAKEIGASAFNGCHNLSEVYLPSVTNIDSFAFAGCDALTRITFGALESVVNHYSDGIFSSDDTGSIDLIIPCTQKELILGGDGNWMPTDTLYSDTDDYANGVFMGYTFKSVSFSHVSDEYEYFLSEDFTTATRTGICLICSTEYDVETSTAYADGKVTATFEDGDVTVFEPDFSDGIGRNADQLRVTVSYLLSMGERELDITLPAEADIDKLFVIREALVKAEGLRDGSVSLTLRGVTEIPDYNFYDSDTGIGKYGIFGLWYTEDGMENVFALSSVTLTDAVYIGENAFYSCEWLSYFSAPLVIEVGESAFSFTALSEVYLPLVETVGESTFAGCAVSEISLPSAKEIGKNAFQYCQNLSKISLPSAKEIGESAFFDCYNLSEVYLPSVTTVGMQAFYNCNVTELSLPSAKEIGDSAFDGCHNLSEVYLPSVNRMGFGVFLDCDSLTRFTLGKLEAIDNFSHRFFFHGVDTGSIDLIIPCTQKELSLGDDGYWTPTDTLYTETDAYANRSFFDCTFKSLTLSHEAEYTDNGDGTHRVSCQCCEFLNEREWHSDANMDLHTGKCDCGAFAAGASVAAADGVTTYYEYAEDAINAACGMENSTVVLLEDESYLMENIQINSGNFTIDLNGKSLYFWKNIFGLVINGGNVVIKDSIGGKEVGYIELHSGSLTLQSGSFGIISINGETYTLDDILADGYCFYDKNGNVVDLSTVEADENNWYWLEIVTVAEIKQ